MRHRTRASALIPVILLALGAAGCGSSTSSSTSTTEAAKATITVAAAASLTDAFNRIGPEFTARTGTDVEFTYDSSSTLANQIAGGAPVDTFASADSANMTKLADAGLVAGDPVVFAQNELVIVTKHGNPAGVTGLESLATAGTIALCGPDVPCGKYAAQALQKANVTIPESDVTRGQNVRATLTAVSEGDAVAGIVYETDAKAAADKVDTVAIPDAYNVLATYPAAAIQGSLHLDAARDFVEYLSGSRAQAILAEYGFLPPP